MGNYPRASKTNKSHTLTRAGHTQTRSHRLRAADQMVVLFAIVFVACVCVLAVTLHLNVVQVFFWFQFFPLNFFSFQLFSFRSVFFSSMFRKVYTQTWLRRRRRQRLIRVGILCSCDHHDDLVSCHAYAGTGVKYHYTRTLLHTRA